jgi:hypothetical protein
MKPTKQKILIMGAGDCRPIKALIESLLKSKYHVVTSLNHRERRKFNPYAFPDAPPSINIHTADREHVWYLHFDKAKKNKHYKK